MDTSYRKYENCLDQNSYNTLFYMVRLTGIEPVTYGLEGRFYLFSNQCDTQ